MTEHREPVLTGGCQCGAVRYALYSELIDPSICHCRMCQKAFGAFFAPLGGVARQDFAWTRGAPRIFDSSSAAERGFCANCGTPLTFEYLGTDKIDVSLGSLDEPERGRPVVQYGIESRVSWVAQLPGLPSQRTEEEGRQEMLDRIAATNRQHPDHDTNDWTPPLSHPPKP